MFGGGTMPFVAIVVNVTPPSVLFLAGISGLDVLRSEADVEKGSGVTINTCKSETIRNIVSLCCRIVFNVDLVPDVLIQMCTSSGQALGQLKWNVVRNDCHGVGVIRTAEGVQIGIVRQWVIRDQRGFPMAGSKGRLKPKKA